MAEGLIMQRGFKTQIVIRLSDEQQEELIRWQRCTTMHSGLVRRGYVILLLAADIPIAQVAHIAGMGRRHVYKWATRFVEQGIHGLADKPGRGRKPSFSPAGRSARGGVGLRAA
jgi:hypothetical protein